jgi:uncharacterized spore protein YtfJ
MSESDRSFFAKPLHDVGEVHALLGRLFRIAEPGAVYSAPLTTGDRTVIVASELSLSIGAGAGFGHNTSPDQQGNGAASHDETGGGGGGGGFAFGRPVAAIIVEPTGARVEPIVDVTKLGLAFLTTLGAMFFAWTALRRTTRQLAGKTVGRNLDART